MCKSVHLSPTALLNEVANLWIFNNLLSERLDASIILIPMSLIMSEVDGFLNTFKSFFKCFLPCELSTKYITRFRGVGLWSTLPALLIVFVQTFSVFINCFFINLFFYDFMSFTKKDKGLPHLSWTHLWASTIVIQVTYVRPFISCWRQITFRKFALCVILGAVLPPLFCWTILGPRGSSVYLTPFSHHRSLFRYDFTPGAHHNPQKVYFCWDSLVLTTLASEISFSGSLPPFPSM